MDKQYRKDYNRGWRYSETANANLDTADSKGWTDSNAWMDGYLDLAAGRDKWHTPNCPTHGDANNTCGQG